MAGRPLDRQRMRRDLHARAAVPALYRASEADDWQPVEVRIHNREPTSIGGGLDGAAERREIKPRVIFMVEQVAMPARNGLVSVAAGEAYRLADALPIEGFTVTVSAARVPAAQAAELPRPEMGV